MDSISVCANEKLESLLNLDISLRSSNCAVFQLTISRTPIVVMKVVSIISASKAIAGWKSGHSENKEAALSV